MSHYQCPACHQPFFKVEEALVHVNSHAFHQRRCVVSGCVRTEPRSLYKHTSTSHSSECEYHCSSCTRVFVRQCHLSQHEPHCHGPNVKKKRSSKRISKTKSLLCPYQCSSCTRGFCSQHGLTQHTKDKHGGISFVHNPVPSFSNVYLGKTSPTATSSLLNRCKQVKQELTIQNQSTKNTFDLNSPTDANSLNKFIDDELQPDQTFNSLMDSTVNDICSFFQSVMSPKEIVKGGSMGKGTAVKGKADIDLVLILNAVSDARELDEELPGIKRDIEKHLRNDQSPRRFVVKDNSIKTTTFLVQFTVLAGDKEIDIDLLPTFYFTDKRDLYKKMREGPSSLEAFYSAALVKMQVDFVSRIPANVKNLIRLVKYWRKEYVVQTSTAQRLPSSYVLELITIHLWESKGEPSNFDTVKAFHSVMEALANVRALSVFWEDNYYQSDIPIKVREKRPLVMDPANPFNNVCSRYDWEKIAQKAQEALRGQMLKNISSARWN